MNKDIFDRIRNSKKKVFIYGAGAYGKRLFLYMSIRNLVDNLECFVVSSLNNNDSNINGIPIVEFQNVNKRLSGSIVIVAFKNSEDICRELKKMHDVELFSIDRELFNQMPQMIFDACCEKKIKNNKIFFSCFFGRGYTCNCKYIAEKLMENDRNFDFVWEISSPKDNNLPKVIKTVEVGSPEYYLELYTSRIVVCNNGFDHGLKKRKEQYIIDTWHGAGPTKKIGIDVNSVKNNCKVKQLFMDLYSTIDLMVAASDLCVRNYREAFLYKGEILKIGYPRNDLFFRQDRDEIRRKIRDFVEVRGDELLVLYAPTYRYEQWEKGNKFENMKQRYDLPWQEIRTVLEEKFLKKATLLYRFHHVTDRGLDVHGRFSEGIDVTDYPDMQELLLAADILITDYSSSMWDFSLQRKPVFLFYDDVDDVDKEVGFYRHPDEYPYPKGHNGKELCMAIKDFDDASYQKKLDEWFKEYVSYDDGHASERVAMRIIDVIEHPEKYGKG